MVEIDIPSPTVSQRAAALHRAIEEIRHLKSKRMVQDALNIRNRPSITMTKGNPYKGYWDGPYPLLLTNKEDCVVETNNGPTTFRSTSIKLWYQTEHEESEESVESTGDVENSSNNPDSEALTLKLKVTIEPKKPPPRNRQPPKRFRNDINVFTVTIDGKIFYKEGSVFDKQFEKSRLKEINGLIAIGVFELIRDDCLPPGVRLFGSKFVDQIKFEGTQKAFEKSRLVVQVYNDAGKKTVLTMSPTIQRLSQPRAIFVRLPTGIRQWIGFFLKCVKPLYGVLEAGNHWFNTYHGHHVKKLKMTPATYDNCLLSINTEEEFGVCGLQTDDTFFFGNKTFIAVERQEMKVVGFKSKDVEKLTVAHPVQFNGGHVKLGVDGSIQLTQDTKDIKLFNKRIIWQKENCAKGLKFVKLDRDLLKLVMFTDGLFANLKDYYSQIGYVCVLTDKYDNANLLHWSSVCCKRVTRSVLALELYGMSEGFDAAGAIKSILEQILKIDVLPLTMCTDSKSLYDCIVKLGTTREKRLMIDLMCLRQAYERKEISEVVWVEGFINPADAMTKSNCNDALKQLIDTNKLVIKPMEWVERE
ncbi:hypothetical protein VTL71DRAFT_10852 [Oculimacula yallundae]|uniref:Polyprotein n=1 Tax=Oculimacula yallundae TaxID=86028 RepID=A0ABR4CU96_9HELO